MSGDQARSYFDRFSDRWSGHYAKNGAMAGRVARFAGALHSRVAAPADILDFGCGTGEIARGLNAAGYRVSAVDVSAGMLDQARARDEGAAIRWSAIEPGAALPFADRTFDGIVSSSVLEYVPDPEMVLKEFARIVRPGGWVLFTAPDPRHPIRRREARVAAFSRCDPLYRLLRLTRWEPVHTYLRISCTRWHPDTWAEALGRAGFAADPVGDCADPLMMVEARRVG